MRLAATQSVHMLPIREGDQNSSATQVNDLLARLGRFKLPTSWFVVTFKYFRIYPGSTQGSDIPRITAPLSSQGFPAILCVLVTQW